MRYYRLKYMYQSCFDDGGPGHDMYWNTTTEEIKAKTDKEARQKAREILEPSEPCRGSWCDNKGRKNFLDFERVTQVVIGDKDNVLITTITQKKLTL